MSDPIDNIHPNTEKINLKRHFVQRYICLVFRSLGASIGRYPWWYCLVSFLVAAMFSARIYWVRLTKGTEYLYSPIHARSFRERDAIESIFPPTSDGFDAITLTRFRRMGTVLMEAKNGGSVLTEDIIREAIRIDKIIHDITVLRGNNTYTYTDLCSKQDSGECQSNNVLQFRGQTDDIKSKRFPIKYPAHIDRFTQKLEIYALTLGGVTTDENDFIVDARALRLIYILNQKNTGRDIVELKWEESFQEVVLNIKSDYVRLSLATTKSIDKEFSKVTEMILPLIPVTAFIMVTFAVFSCMTRNWVTSKPLVAIAGCISPILGVALAFGLLLLCGVEYIDLNVIILFLLIGIGLDDSFVMLAAWRRTDSREEVEVRMSQTYEEAAVSITITSITNILSLCVGLSTPYRIVRLYCSYAATSTFFAYVYQITFFGGILALSGYREKRNLHPLLCITVNKECIPDPPLLKFLYFGCNNEDGNEDSRINDYKLSFVEKFLVFVTTRWGKSTVIALYLIYLTSTIYCFRFVKEGFDYRDAMPSYSYLIHYFNMHYQHFTQYPHAIHVVINKTLDYSNKQVQKDVEDMIQNLCNGTDMASSNFSLSWLKYYLQSTRESILQLSYRGYNMSHPNDFIAGLREVFLKLPYARSFRQHVRFNHNRTQIVASRFIIFSKNIGTFEKEKRLLLTMLNKADSCKYRVYVNNIWFPLYSILLEITSSITESLLTATATVTVVFFIFIPNLLCTTGILITIISILIGVIGYMSLWSVPINTVSMICLLLSVGLCVDYASHISYAYLTCSGKNSNGKMKVALRHAGYPIIQGCASTVLGVTVLRFCPSPMFLVFFKVISLVMLMSLFHGLLVIPVMLSLLETVWKILSNQCHQRINVTSRENNNLYRRENVNVHLTE